MRVSSLFVHPVKSGRAQPVPQLAFDARGPLGDRRYMVVDARDRFLSQRELPALTALSATLDGDGITLQAPGRAPLYCAPVPGRLRQVTVWAASVAAQDCGDAAAAWLTALCGRPARLVFQGAEGERPVRRFPEHQVSFADGYPLLVVSASAVEALAARLGKPVAIERFRPNIVIEGCPPHAEDGWLRIRIGANTFELAAPCKRCAIPGLDPATGAVMPGFNRVLAGYRSMGGAVYFGMNALHLGEAPIVVGDAVEVLSHAD